MTALSIIAAVLLVALLLAGCVIVGGISLGILEVLRDIWRKDNTTQPIQTHSIMANMYLDLCLSDIPKERIKTAANGKKYLKCIVKPRKEMDRDGYDHYVAVFIPSAERQDGQGPAFIGRAQEKHYEDDKHVGGTPFKSKPVNEENDLPFD